MITNITTTSATLNEGFYCSVKNRYCIRANSSGYCSTTACMYFDYETISENYTYEAIDDFDEIEQLKMRKELEKAVGSKSKNKMVEYTSKWKDFQFRSPNYLDGHFSNYEFDLVKWNDNTCYSIGRLVWDAKEKEFEFESVGLRFLQDYVEGLNEWVIAFAKMKEIELRSE